jgi:RNA polymerase sigma-70 factor (ECF subfamily)
LHFEKTFARKHFSKTEHFRLLLSLYKRVAKMIFAKQQIFLVLRVQAGDKEAFNELLKSVQQPLFRYIYRLTGERALAEDVLQEVFIIIYRKIKWLENPKLFSAWAYRIASRETFRQLKTEKHWMEQIRDEEMLNQAQAVETEEIYEHELIAKIPDLLAEISPASRAVIVLHYLEEMPLSQTAEILDIAVGTAKSRLAYGLESLRKIIRRQN